MNNTKNSVFTSEDVLIKWIEPESKASYKTTKEDVRMRGEYLVAIPASEEYKLSMGYKLLKMFGSIVVGTFSLFGGTLVYSYFLNKELWPIIIIPSIIVILFSVPLIYYFCRLMKRLLS